MQATSKYIANIMQRSNHSVAETTEVIRDHIEASAPCMLKGVIQWAKSQGYGGTPVICALYSLKADGIIWTDFDDDGETIVDLV